MRILLLYDGFIKFRLSDCIGFVINLYHKIVI